MASSSVIIVSVFLVVEFSSLTSPDVVRCNTSRPAEEKRALSKRSVLTFPPDSVLQINMGITLAGHLENNNAIVVLAFQQNSPLPKEAQPLLLPSLVVTGRQFSIFDHLKSVLASYGFNGTECLRKMVCQVREAPLVGGLMEDIIGFVLSPTRHRSIGNEEEAAALLEAERLAASGGDCSRAFPQCTRSPLDFISTLIQG